MTWAYYNEFDPYAAKWLRNLIAAGHIPAGEVDTRDIREVMGDDLREFTQVHLFAGIGGWSRALHLAGWPEARAIWTGSCPCQPFSAAGKRKGTADDRHLWPEMQRLVAECLPPVVAGEQVASKDGREWLAGVRADLEALGYAVGAADLCAASAGAPHIRQRLWWVADALARPSSSCGLADTGRSGDECGGGPEEASRAAEAAEGEAPEWERSGPDVGRCSGHSGFWDAFDFIPCGDGKARRVEPGTLPLAHGVPARVGKLRAYGNAICPQVAAEFITAYIETIEVRS